MRPVWLFSNLPPPVHGVSAFNAAMLEVFEQRGIPYRVFRIGTRGAVAHVERFELQKLYGDAAALSRLVVALRQHREDSPVVYFTPSLSGSAVLRDLALSELCSRVGAPIIAHIHNGAWLSVWRRAGAVQRTLMLRVLRHCEGVICLGDTLAGELRAATGLPAVAVNNGISSRLPWKERSAPRHRLELLFLSNLQREKGLWTAAHATRLLTRQAREVRLRCAGNWRSERDRDVFLREFSDEIETGTIELVGFADENAKGHLLQRSDFLLLPSELLEGQPLSIIEAMAAGLVPLVTAVGGIPDLFGFDNSERLMSSRHRDPGVLAASIDEIASSESTYLQLSKACRNRYLSALTLEQCAERVIQVLQGES